MRRLITLLVGAAVLLVGGAAFAQQGETETQFIEFNEHDIEGSADDPNGILVEERGESEFEPLADVEKKSFMEEVRASSEDL